MCLCRDLSLQIASVPAAQSESAGDQGPGSGPVAAAAPKATKPLSSKQRKAALKQVGMHHQRQTAISYWLPLRRMVLFYVMLMSAAWAWLGWTLYSVHQSAASPLKFAQMKQDRLADFSGCHSPVTLAVVPTHRSARQQSWHAAAQLAADPVSWQPRPP